MDVAKPKLGWIYQKSCFNQHKESLSENQLTGISPSERLGCMFETGLYSDCSFLVEGIEIRAHKLILAAASPKMENMFLGFEVTDTELVEIPFSLRVMQLILKHVYLQDMDIENIDEAQDVIEAANFFQMNDLVELCCAGIEPETLDDLWPALNLACLYNSRALKEACLSVALQNSSNSILEHEGLLQISPQGLSFLLSREVINVESEIEIIKVVISWAQHRLEKTPEDTSNIRHHLEKHGLLQQLRILALNELQFIEFITDLGKELFSEKEINRLEYNYFTDTCESYICPLRTERMLEHRVPISGTDYLAVNNKNDNITVTMKIYETNLGVRPIIKMIVLPSQINPANILYDNVSHRTHYDECILVEMSVNGKVTARGSFCDRVKYGDDVFIIMNTFLVTPFYICKQQEFYEVNIKIMLKKHGYYPLAVETKTDLTAIAFEEPCRFIHEIILCV